MNFIAASLAALMNADATKSRRWFNADSAASPAALMNADATESQRWFNTDSAASPAALMNASDREDSPMDVDGDYVNDTVPFHDWQLQLNVMYQLHTCINFMYQ